MNGERFSFFSIYFFNLDIYVIFTKNVNHMKKLTLFFIIVLCISCNMDTEYLGHYVAKAVYEEPWNEYIHKTCHRTVHDGYDKDGHEITHEESYDCSYVDYHYPQWYYIREDGHRVHISQKQYNILLARLNTPAKFVDMHRHYYTIDGDKYETHFDGNRSHMWTLTESCYYKNKIIRSKSVFNFSKVDKKTFDEWKLYDYPSFDYFNDQNPIIGIQVPSSVVDSFRYINAYYGPKKQFRCYVMVWRNMPMEVSKYEQDFLVGGNKNELIVCMSIDNNNNVQWVNSFSWEDYQYLEVGINHLYENGEKLNLMKLNRYLINNINKWKRKEFKDFDYL